MAIQETQWLAGDVLTPQGLNNYTPTGWDATTFTVTAAATTQGSHNYTINANDANVGTAYRLMAWGQGTQGSTQQALNTWFNLYGLSNMNGQFAASQVAISTGFWWNYEATAVVTSLGSSGSMIVWGRCTLSTKAATTNVNAGTFAAGSGSITVNTTVSTVIGLQLGWGSTVGAPTITCWGSLFDRIGL